MKITIDARMINHSGIGTYLSSILNEIVSKPIKVYLLGNEEVLRSFKQKNVEIIDFNYDIYTVREQLGFLTKAPKDADLFWSPHYNVPIFTNSKLIVTIHDAFHLAYPPKNFIKKIYPKIMFHLIRKKASKVITVSEFSKKEIIKFSKIENDKIKVIYNGLKKLEESTIKLPISSEREFLLYVGNIKPHKNLKILLKAFNLIRDKVNVDLVLVGKKDGFITTDDEVMMEIGDLVSLGRVHFTGEVSEGELGNYYKECKLFIFPSKYEGFGLPPLEAMSFSKTVVASEIPVHREIYGDSCEFFPPDNHKVLGEKIFKLLNNDKYRKSFEDKSKKQVKKYRWETSAKEHYYLLMNEGKK